MTRTKKDKRFKLTPMQVRAIQILYQKGWKQVAIAAKYSISQQYVSVLLRTA